MYVLRGYQQKAVDEIVEFIKGKKNKGVAVLPTSAGKSLILAETIKHLGNIPTIVLQPSVELLKQNYEKFISQGGKASLYSASVGIKEVGNVTYATPASIKNEWEKFKHVKLILVDECHTNCKKDGMIDKFIKKLNKGVKVLGVTATPVNLKSYNGDSGYYSQLNIITRVRPKFWSSIMHVTQVKDLYEKGYLTPLRFTTFNYNMRNVKSKGADFNLEEVSKVIEKNKVIPFAAKLVKESLKRGKKKILIFTPTLKEAFDIKKLIPHIEVVAGKTKKKERESTIENFVNGDLKVIANYGTLLTGFDAPKIDLIICLRPTQSYTLHAQLLGRGVRLSPGKEVCDIIDLSGNFREFGDPKDLVFEDHKDYGWGMFVNDYLLSGIPIGQKIHKDDLGIANQKISFGKHKGTPFKDIPTSYLEYLRDTFDISSSWSKKNIVKPLKQLGIIK